jgi:hypothetical protein
MTRHAHAGHFQKEVLTDSDWKVIAKRLLLFTIRRLARHEKFGANLQTPHHYVVEAIRNMKLDRHEPQDRRAVYRELCLAVDQEIQDDTA